MNVLILILCTVAALAIHRAIIRPLFEAFEARSADAKRRALIERANVAAAKLNAERKAKAYPNSRGGRLAAERDWRSSCR